MASFVVLLVLLSALMHASWNAFLHVSGDRLWLLGMFSIPYIVVSAIAVCVLPLHTPLAAELPEEDRFVPEQVWAAARVETEKLLEEQGWA